MAALAFSIYHSSIYHFFFCLNNSDLKNIKTSTILKKKWHTCFCGNWIYSDVASTHMISELLMQNLELDDLILKSLAGLQIFGHTQCHLYNQSECVSLQTTDRTNQTG